MNGSLGRISATLAEREESTVTDELLALINANIAPPTAVTEQDVYIRSMYIVSDQVNSFGGRFPIEEFDRLTQLLIDSPVLVGHRKDKLPVGRNFHAVRTVRDGCPWVRSYFFWMRSADGADTLRDNIDGGIYKECSIGFTFLLPQCSICGSDIRTCEHLPLREYSGQAGGSEICHFDYRQIEKVLETSLVYRGATPNTALTKALTIKPCAPETETVAIGDLAVVEGDGPFLVIPSYEGVPVTASVQSGRLALQSSDGNAISCELCAQFPSTEWPDRSSSAGILVGYRGKERCSEQAVRQYLNDRTGPVARLTLHLLPRSANERLVSGDEKSRFSLRTIRHRVVDRATLAEAAHRLATRTGVHIMPVASQEDFRSTRRYHLVAMAEQPCDVILTAASGSPSAQVSIRYFGERLDYEIRQFDIARWRHGGRFVADRVMPSVASDPAPQLLFRGDVFSEPIRAQDAIALTVAGQAPGTVMLRPILLDGRRRFLCSWRGATGNRPDWMCG